MAVKPLVALKKSTGSKVNPNVTWETAFLLGYIRRMWEEAGLGPFTLTSLKDGRHWRGSLHRQDKPKSVPGQAADIRTRSFFTGTAHKTKLTQFARSLQQKLGKHGLKVVVHPDWVGGTAHLHVAYDPRKGKLWGWTA